MDLSYPETCEILGRRYVAARPDFATAEELVAQLAGVDLTDAAGVGRVHRIAAAVLGCCTQIGTAAKADWVKSGCNALRYGGQVYSWLREQGVNPMQICEAARPFTVALKQIVFPRDVEIAEKTSFFGGGGADSSTPPSA